jgi:hypothetical protein
MNGRTSMFLNVHTQYPAGDWCGLFLNLKEKRFAFQCGHYRGVQSGPIGAELIE